jgi:predicted MFS family arabinose efflux permease
LPLALLVTATVLSHTAFGGGRLAIMLTALAMGASPFVAGVLASLVAAVPMLIAVRAGKLVDRIGVRYPLVAAPACVAMAVVIPAAFPGFASLFVAAALVGVAFMFFHISVQHAIGEGSTGEKRKDNFGWLSLGFSISNFLGPSTAGFAIDYLGNRIAFMVLSLFAFAAFALLALQRAHFRHTPHHLRGAPDRSAFELLRDAELRRVFVVTGMLAAAWDLFVFAVPVYGHSIRLSASTIGSILACFAVATFLVRLALPWISRHLQEWAVITMTFGIACFGYAIFPLVTTVPLLAAISFLLGLGLGATQPSVMSLIYATAPAGRGGEAVGIRSVVLNASSTFLPLAFGGVGEAVGMLPVFWTMALALAGGGAIADRRRRAGLG